MMSSKALNEKPNAEPLPKVGTAGVIVDGHYSPPPQDKDGKIWVRTSALVHSAPETLYEMWRDVESVPHWQEQITRVTRTGEKTSHWVMGAKENDQDQGNTKKKSTKAAKTEVKNNDDEAQATTIEWDSEIVADEPGKRIAWRSVGGESRHAGEVVFELSPGSRATLVTVLQEFEMGKLASAWETIVGRNPRQAVIENLRHFKALAETGEIPRTQGQPHGPRGRVARVKEAAYGETITTPPGLNRKAS